MEEPTTLYGKSVSKAEAVATTVNMLIGELLHRSRREEGYRDYFDIAVLGYHDEVVEPLLCKGKRLFVKPSELYERDTPRLQIQRERKLPDGRTLFSVVEQREWITPFAQGQTPMHAAFLKGLVVERVQPAGHQVIGVGSAEQVALFQQRPQAHVVPVAVEALVVAHRPPRLAGGTLAGQLPFGSRRSAAAVGFAAERLFFFAGLPGTGSDRQPETGRTLRAASRSRRLAYFQ